MERISDKKTIGEKFGNKHVNLDTVRYCYLGGVSNQIFYKFPINKDIKIGIY